MTIAFNRWTFATWNGDAEQHTDVQWIINCSDLSWRPDMRKKCVIWFTIVDLCKTNHLGCRWVSARPRNVLSVILVHSDYEIGCVFYLQNPKRVKNNKILIWRRKKINILAISLLFGEGKCKHCADCGSGLRSHRTLARLKHLSHKLQI